MTADSYSYIPPPWTASAPCCTAAHPWFLDTGHGKNAYRTVKHLSAEDGPGQPWLYGFTVTDSAPNPHNDGKGLLIRAVTVHECSPVVRAAGPFARTLSAKSYRDDSLPTDLAGEMNLIEARLIAEDWRQRQAFQMMRLRMIADEFRQDQAERTMREVRDRWP